jgi:hypothetical protein
VKQLPVHGERVHDARIVAVLQAHAVEHLLTCDGADFVAFPSLSWIDPRSLFSTPGQ